MTSLKLEGVVATDYERLWIGDGELFALLDALWPETIGRYESQAVTVALGDETFTGDLYAEEGARGYSEWTPGEVAILRIGEHDLFRRLEDLKGCKVTLWVSDEPVNTLA